MSEFHHSHTSDDLRHFWKGWIRNPLAIGAFAPSGKSLAKLMAKGVLNGVSFAVSNLEETFEKVRASGAEVMQEPMDQPWGARDCAFRDPSGNMVRINQA